MDGIQDASDGGRIERFLLLMGIVTLGRNMAQYQIAPHHAAADLMPLVKPRFVELRKELQLHFCSWPIPLKEWRLVAEIVLVGTAAQLLDSAPN